MEDVRIQLLIQFMMGEGLVPSEEEESNRKYVIFTTSAAALDATNSSSAVLSRTTEVMEVQNAQPRHITEISKDKNTNVLYHINTVTHVLVQSVDQNVKEKLVNLVEITRDDNAEMRIPIGEFSLCTALGGIRPSVFEDFTNHDAFELVFNHDKHSPSVDIVTYKRIRFTHEA
ncbi:hypothetical protein MKW98_025548, partial [Papaver atlanticum]